MRVISHSGIQIKTNAEIIFYRTDLWSKNETKRIYPLSLIRPNIRLAKLISLSRKIFEVHFLWSYAVTAFLQIQWRLAAFQWCFACNDSITGRATFLYPLVSVAVSTFLQFIHSRAQYSFEVATNCIKNWHVSDENAESNKVLAGAHKRRFLFPHSPIWSGQSSSNLFLLCVPVLCYYGNTSGLAATRRTLEGRWIYWCHLHHLVWNRPHTVALTIWCNM